MWIRLVGPLVVLIFGIGGARAAAGVQVRRDAVAVPVNSTDDIGPIATMTPVPVTYTLANIGDAELSVIDLHVFSPLNGGCSVSVNPSGTTVAPGSSTTFEITLRADVAGPSGCTVRIVSNEPRQLYPFTLRGTATDLATAPEVEVGRGAVTLADGDAVIVDAPAGMEFIDDVTVRNLGDATLLVGPVEVTAQTGATCTLVSAAVTPVLPGQAVPFRLAITRADTAPWTCDLTIQSTDADEPRIVVRFTSTRPGPHLRVLVNGAAVTSVAPADVDNPVAAIQPGLQTAHALTLQSVGTAALTGVGITASGPCQVTTDVPPSIAAGGAAMTTVLLYRDPDGGICVLEIASADVERPRFLVTIAVPRAGASRGCSTGGAAGGWGVALALALAVIARRGRRT